MAPEVMLGKQIDGKSDVYSFGLCVWELFSCQEPYQEFTNFNDFRRAVCFKQQRPDMVTNAPDPVKQLIVRCWDNEPKVRPSFTEIIDLLPDVFLNCMIASKTGKEFWRSNFYKDGQFPLEIGWDQFAHAFCKYISLPGTAVNDTGLLSCKNLISERSRHPGGDRDVVMLDRFGDFVTQFGPLQPGKADIVERLTELAMYKPKKKLASHVFFGNIGAQEAEKYLAGQENGTWLVRVSNKDPTQPFVISKVSRHGAINHQRISVDSKTGTYKLEIRVKDKVKLAEGQGSLVKFLKSVREDL